MSNLESEKPFLPKDQQNILDKVMAQFKEQFINEALIAALDNSSHDAVELHGNKGEQNGL